jgi:transposase
MVTGIFYVLRTGTPWRDLPVHFGPWSSVYTRFRRWCAAGLFGRMLALAAKSAAGELRHIDCYHIKLHQDGTNPAGGQQLQAIGRTKGGINTKLSAIVENGGRAVALSLSAGQRHDLYAVEPLLPCLRGYRAVADKGFDADTFRARLCRQRTRVCIPAKRSRRSPVRFTTATTGSGTRSKTSSAASSVSAALVRATINCLSPFSASSNSRPLSIGSLIDFENTP